MYVLNECNTYYFLFDPHSMVSCIKHNNKKCLRLQLCFIIQSKVPRVCKETLQEILFQSDLLRALPWTLCIVLTDGSNWDLNICLLTKKSKYISIRSNIKCSIVTVGHDQNINDITDPYWQWQGNISENPNSLA